MQAAKGAQSQGEELSTEITSIGVAAHELKSPLVLLRQLALELANNSLDEAERQHIADQLVHISEQALRLTSNLTRAERLQTALFPLEPVNPLQICEDVQSELSDLFTAQRRTLLVKRQQQIMPVVANRDLLRRILLNFADNALHYGNTNGSVIVEATMSRKRQRVRVGVRDFGPALPISNWRKVIQALDHSHQPLQSRPLSSGLGLYISNQFAQAMNGTIGAIRHKDGVSFYVELPISHQMSLL